MIFSYWCFICDFLLVFADEYAPITITSPDLLVMTKSIYS